MHRRLTSLAPALLAVGLLLTAAAPAASAAVVAKRTWTATIAANPTTGTASVAVLSDGTGTVTIRLAGIAPQTTHNVEIYNGTCARPNVIAKLPTFRGSASGGAARTFKLSRTAASAVMTLGTRSPIAIRFAHDMWYRCAALTYPRASRIAISGLGIDLPIVLQKTGYPLCNVAMYLLQFSQPGEPGPAFIYAHARTGMFLPLLTQSKIRNGAGMVGMTVRVWRSDSKLYTYRITRVLRRQYTFPVHDPLVEQLWLQTSEGPAGTPNKLIIVAQRVGIENASASAANPTPRPVRCGP